MFWHKWSGGTIYYNISGPGGPIMSNINGPPGPLMAGPYLCGDNPMLHLSDLSVKIVCL